jgi:L-malate glycosyltransferase
LNIGITCFPTFGGSGIVATEIGLRMAKRGHQVHFICAELPFRFDHFVENVFFHEVAARDYPLFDQSPYALALTSKMVEVAEWQKLDLLHVHYAIPHAASAYLAKQILGAAAPKVITTLHGTDITVVGNDPSFLPITRFSIAQSDAVTTPSESLKQTTWSNLGVRVPIDVIPNFVDTDVYRPAPRAQGPRLIVHNSNFRPVKRVDDVVRIFAALRHPL